MTRQIYKAFKNTVVKADQYSDVWYAGYLWMDLTPRQAAEIDGILRTKGFLNKQIQNGSTWHVFPNGLLFRYQSAE